MGGVQKRRRSRKEERSDDGRGFTLVELLVVLAIIMVLISLLIAGLRGAREAARTAVCLSNHSQLSKAMSMYGNSNSREIIPREGTVPTEATTENQRRARTPWPVALRPFLDDRVVAGDEPNDLFLNAEYYQDPARPRDGHKVHYVVNSMPMVSRGVIDTGGRIDYRRRRGPSSQTRLRFPETTLYLTEFADDSNGAIWAAMQTLPQEDLYWSQLYDIWDVLHLEPASSQYRISLTRHSGSGNAVFLDGHARTLPKAELKNIDTWDDRDYGVRIESLPRSNP